jgi:hypothetical protein
MKLSYRKLSGVVLLIALSASAAYAQQQFTHTVTRLNKNCNATCTVLDVPELNNNPAAIILVTPILANGMNLNPHPIGAYFMYLKKWSILNLDQTTIVEGAKFNVQYFLNPGADRFVYTVPERGSPCIDHAGLNDNPNAQIRFFPTGSPTRGALYNKDDIKVEYDATVLKWCIANINKKPVASEAAYNIVISSGGAAGSNAPTPSPTPSQTATLSPTKTPTQPIQTKSTTRSTATPTAPNLPQKPCTNADASQKVGSWDKQETDSLATADPSFPKEQYKPVLAKAQKVIELLKQANPQPIGIQAYAYRNISGSSYTANGALPFGVEASYENYICMPDTPGDSERGQIVPNDGRGTMVYVNFNSLGWLTNDYLSLGKNLTTAGGKIIFYVPKQTGELRGLALLRPDLRTGVRDEAVIITAGDRSPYKPITREQFLQALERFYRKLGREAEIAKIESAIAGMSAHERQIQAVIVDPYASLGELFVSESERGSRRLATIDISLFNPALPRQTIQTIVVYWHWNEKNAPGAELIRQFKQNFDFEALKQMLGK